MACVICGEQVPRSSLGKVPHTKTHSKRLSATHKRNGINASPGTCHDMPSSDSLITPPPSTHARKLSRAMSLPVETRATTRTRTMPQTAALASHAARRLVAPAVAREQQGVQAGRERGGRAGGGRAPNDSERIFGFPCHAVRQLFADSTSAPAADVREIIGGGGGGGRGRGGGGDERDYLMEQVRLAEQQRSMHEKARASYVAASFVHSRLPSPRYDLYF